MFRELFHRSQEERGLTLTELLVAVGLIGIIAAIAVPIYLNQRNAAHVGAVKSDVNNVLMLMHESRLDNKYFPGLPEGAVLSSGVQIEVHLSPDDSQACVEGYHESDPSQVWHADSSSKNTKQGPCPSYES